MHRFLLLIVAVITILWSFVALFISMSTSLPQQDVDAAASDFVKMPSTSSTSATSSTTPPVIVVGYVISLVKCGDFQTSTAGLLDSALVLRHSIHLTSVRNRKSRYDYQMYALVHRQAVNCSRVLRDVGFQVIVVDPPIQPEEIKGSKYLRENMDSEWCCGSDEFIKLYALTKVPHPIVVHVDSDFLMLQSMDELFDSMLLDRHSRRGRAARELVEMEFPNEHSIPAAHIQAFYTRDWPQVVPGYTKAGFQAGFMVLRPNRTVFDELMDILRQGNYDEKRGWGGLGYAHFVGAMTMQGLLAYYYEVVRPDIGVELNQCRYNWMGMDVRYNHPPNFSSQLHVTGKCRTNRESCEDCRSTDLSRIKNVHLTQCRKPWNCIGEGAPGGRNKTTKGFIDTDAGNLTKCLEVMRVWHQVRTDLEHKLYKLTKDHLIRNSQNGKYKPEVFMGHCNNMFGGGYNPIRASLKSFRQVPKLYQ